MSTCTHPSFEQRGPINLPVLTDHNPHGTIRKSKNGKRRAVILATIQLLILMHIVLWLLSKKYGWWGGQTLTPIEPSESMEFVKSGVINAGLIFFSIALLSTLILGRWFCGWGCHIVMLQDFCGWIMKKCGIRPKAFRSRVLVYVPLLLALYMFIWPALYRWGIAPLTGTLSKQMASIPDLSNVPPWQTTTHLTTNEFWKTFPGWMVAIPFLFICGFATVYFLGAKGFCTYGCPYGGFFTPLDRLAPGRILVTDACEGCGHCTAVCTSNVRVHEEVREYGMVVNPGCMKCMDCVSVCPKEALYFGFARPSILKGAPKTVAPKRVYDLTLGEEVVMAIVFAGSFFAFRGDLLRFPLLMSAGAAGVLTFLIWKLWRLFRDSNVALHRFQFKLKGSIKPAGWLFALIAVVCAAVTTNVGVVNASYALGQWQASKVTPRPDITSAAFQQPMDPVMAVHADRAIALYRLSTRIGDGGIGFFRLRQVEPELAIAKLHAEKLEFEQSEHMLRRVIERDGDSDRMVASLLWALEAQGRRPEALEIGKVALVAHAGYLDTLESFKQLALRENNGDLLEDVLRKVIERHGLQDMLGRDLMLVMYLNSRPIEALDFADGVLLQHAEMPVMLDFYRRVCADMGQPERVIDLFRKRLERFPSHLLTLRMLSILLLEVGEVAESVEVTRRTIEIDPNNASARYFLAMGLAQSNRQAEAIDELKVALNIDPRSVMMHALLAELLVSQGKMEEAQFHRDTAQRLAAEQSDQAGHPHQ